MIGNDTLLVKKREQYDVHIVETLSFYFATCDYRSGKIPDLYEYLVDAIEKWKPDAVVGYDEAMRIAEAHSCIEGAPLSSKFAGDVVYLLDCDTRMFYRWDRRYTLGNGTNTWEEVVR